MYCPSRIWLVIIVTALNLAACADLRQAKRDYQLGRYQEAEKQWLVLADKGFPEAYSQLSRFYLEGNAPSGSNLQKAIYYFNLAHQAGFTNQINQISRFIENPKTPLYFKQQIVTQVTLLAQQKEQIKARLILAQLQLEGVYVAQDKQAALATLTQLSNMEEPMAIALLADIYRLGIDVEKDLNKAFELDLLGDKLGYKRSSYALANSYEFALGTTLDLAAAESTLRRLRQIDPNIANFRLAAFLERNNLSNEQEVITLYNNASSAGYGPAKLRMAELYLHGQVVEKQVEKAIKMLREMSLSGYGSASAKLGDIYRDGEHLTLDYNKALYYYNLSIEQGFENGQLRVAKMLANGLGIKRDIDAAKAIYKRFATKGVANAAFEYAVILEQQQTHAILSNETFKWYQNAADAGHINALLKVAYCLLNGYSVPQDIDKGKNILKQLVDQDSPAALMMLAKLYQTGEFVVQQLDKSEKYYLTALKLGEQRAIFKLAEIYSNPSYHLFNLDKAKAIYQKLDLFGRLDTSFKLVRLYEGYLGQGAIPPALVQWYKDASNTGYVPAQLRYADLMLTGTGMEQDSKTAISTFHFLSKQGVGAASARIANLYRNGEFEKQDHRKAKAYYLLAIEQGYQTANLHLAELLYNTKKPLLDIQHAHFLLQKMAYQNNAKAQLSLANMYFELQQQLADNWLDLAIYWYQKSAHNGLLDARFKLAQLIDLKAGKATKEANLIFSELALLGHGSSQLIYGTRKFNGLATEQDQTLGMTYVFAAAFSQTKQAVPTLLQQILEVNALAQVDIAMNNAAKLERSRISLELTYKNQNEEVKHDTKAH